MSGRIRGAASLRVLPAVWRQSIFAVEPKPGQAVAVGGDRYPAEGRLVFTNVLHGVIG